ncbi:MAG: (Fe-S)-binding protein [Gaiellales bacterium]
MDTWGVIADHVGVPSVVLFPTCLGDVVAQQTVDDATTVLTRLGLSVRHPRGATCCGQPAFNSGHDAPARAVARATLRALDDGSSDPVLVPSGSCTSMVRLHWREVFHGTSDADAALRVARRVRELSSFLAEQSAAISALQPRLTARVAYHDSCHMLRELRIKQAPRDVLAAIDGVELVELPGAERCCGFGGTFAVRYPEVSVAMAESKLDELGPAGVDLLVSADPGCLLQLGGRLSREGSPVRAVHLATVLAEALA